MIKKPTNLQELFRLALASQVDLGFKEVVLTSPRMVQGELPKALVGTVTRRVSVTQAMAGAESDVPEQSEADQVGMGLASEPEFKSLTEHCQAIQDCQKCSLGQTRTKFVYGVGNPKADLMFIGEAPGADEDRKGEPFVGRAGQLLDRILAAIGFSRDEVYIANMLKCRPPNNRDPQSDEMDLCTPYLREQIRLIRPKLICMLGRIAAQGLLKTTTPLGKMRGRWHEFEGIPALVTYHPAALLRFQAYKKDTWEDMKLLKSRYDELTGKTE